MTIHITFDGVFEVIGGIFTLVIICYLLAIIWVLMTWDK